MELHHPTQLTQTQFPTCFLTGPYDDGETWDFQSDRLIIEGKTGWGIASGGGFGNTIQLADGTLISCSTYRWDNDTPLEVIRWRLPAY